MKKSILRWELFGILFIFILGFPWHYVFRWLGGWRPAALVFPVNESTWEHAKLCFWPGLIWALIEYPFIGRRIAGFWAAKAAGLFTMTVLMALLFYGYVAVLGRSVLWANLLVFGIATAAGQLVSYRILTGPALSPAVRRLGTLGLVVMLIAFLLLSYIPPRNFLFLDPNRHLYGILPQ
jgi:multisubunit Na+/H+ antiporter MnhF subunit